MEFRILGPLEVVGEHGPITLHRGKEQALLGYMLLHANELLPSERLIDELWDGRPPATAPKILQNAISQLRRALGDDRIETRAPGYRFRLQPRELDLDRFEQLRNDGKYHEALALWSGPPLVDLRDERFADDARRRLEELRLATLEDRIDNDLAAGKHAQLVPELEQLVREHPLRERLCAQLMLALYRASRQGDALAVYHRARRTLRDELGLEPAPELRELERRILRHEPDLGGPPPSASPRRSRRTMRRLAVAATAGILLLAATVSWGLVYGLHDSSNPLVVKPDSLVAVDARSKKIVAVAPVGAAPRGVAVTADAVWVANSADGTVSKLAADNLDPVQTIGVAAQASDLVAAGGAIWVATGYDDTLVKIDARSGGVVDHVRLSPEPDASAYGVAARDGIVWVTSGERLFKVDARTSEVLNRHERSSCCGSLRDVAVGAGAVWVADLKEEILRISAATVTKTGSVNLGFIPTAVVVANGAVWAASVSNYPSRLVLWRIDPATMRVTQTVTLGKVDSFLATVDVAAGAGAIWASNYEDRTLVGVDPASGAVVAKIPLGRRPHGVAVAGNRVFVTVD